MILIARILGWQEKGWYVLLHTALRICNELWWLGCGQIRSKTWIISDHCATICLLLQETLYILQDLQMVSSSEVLLFAQVSGEDFTAQRHVQRNARESKKCIYQLTGAWIVLNRLAVAVFGTIWISQVRPIATNVLSFGLIRRTWPPRRVGLLLFPHLVLSVREILQWPGWLRARRGSSKESWSLGQSGELEFACIVIITINYLVTSLFCLKFTLSRGEIVEVIELSSFVNESTWGLGDPWAHGSRDSKTDGCRSNV